MNTAFDYKTELNQLRFTPEEKAAMTDRLLSAAQKTAAPKHHAAAGSAVPWRQWPLWPACASARAPLASQKLASDTFSPVFGSAETEIVDKNRPSHWCFCHRCRRNHHRRRHHRRQAPLCHRLHHRKTDGSAFDLDANATVGNGVLPLTFEQQDTNIGLMGGSHGSSYFYDADPRRQRHPVRGRT